MPRPEGYLDSALRAASNLYPTLSSFDRLNVLIIYTQKRSLVSMYTLSVMSFRDYLDIMHRATSDLYPTRPPFKRLNTLIIMPERDLQVSPIRSLQRVLDLRDPTQ